jgi:hypothetical protein
MQRLRFAEWFPMDRCFVEDDDEDSATLKAVRKAYKRLGADNTCEHCAVLASSERPAGAAAYYLV